MTNTIYTIHFSILHTFGAKLSTKILSDETWYSVHTFEVNMTFNPLIYYVFLHNFYYISMFPCIDEKIIYAICDTPSVLLSGGSKYIIYTFSRFIIHSLIVFFGFRCTPMLLVTVWFDLRECRGNIATSKLLS